MRGMEIKKEEIPLILKLKDSQKYEIYWTVSEITGKKHYWVFTKEKFDPDIFEKEGQFGVFNIPKGLTKYNPEEED